VGVEARTNGGKKGICWEPAKERDGGKSGGWEWDFKNIDKVLF